MEHLLKINVGKQQHATPKLLGQTLSKTVAICRLLSPVVVGHRLTSLFVDGRFQPKTADV